MGRIKELVLKPLLLGFLTLVFLGFFGEFWTTTNTNWKRSYKAPNVLLDSAIAHTKDGFLISVPENYGYLQSDYKPIKTDEQGKIEWTSIFGRTGWEESISSIVPTSDGGFVLVGDSSPQLFQTYLYISKIDSTGNEEWHTDIGYPRCSGTDIVEAYQGGYIAVGKRDDAYERYPNLYIVRVDSNGKMVWDKELGGDSYEWADAVCFHDYHFVVAGTCDTESDSGDAIWVMKFNSLGEVIWETRIDGPAREGASDVEVTIDGGYIVAGSTGSWGDGGSSFLAVKFDSSGNEEWRRVYSTDSWDNCHSVTVTSDGGYLFVGSSGLDMMIVKADSEGHEVWRKILGGLYSWDEGFWGFETDSGKYVIGGVSSFFAFPSKVILFELCEGGLPSENRAFWLGWLVKLTILSIMALVIFNVLTKWSFYK